MDLNTEALKEYLPPDSNPDPIPVDINGFRQEDLYWRGHRVTREEYAVLDWAQRTHPADYNYAMERLGWN